MKKIYSVLIVNVLVAGAAWAQNTSDSVYMPNMQVMLWYLFPFCILTIAALALFLGKLLKPQKSANWLYITAVAGIIWAGIVTYQFKKVQDEQLPQVNADHISLMDKEHLSTDNQERLRQLQKEEQSQLYANFWVLGTPNVILLILGIAVDWRSRRKDS